MSNFLLYYCMIVMFMFGCIVFISTRKHLLWTLLSLEFMVLMLVMLLFFIFYFMNYEGYFSMFFFNFLCLWSSFSFINFVTHGNDYFQSFSILQC